MKFRSTSGSGSLVSAKEAIIQGLAPDGGLFMPEHIPQLPKVFLEGLESQSLPEIGVEVAKLFLSEDIEASALRALVEDTLAFPVPMVPLAEQIDILELFHGPTLAFKDFGGRFLGRLVAHFLRGSDREITVLVATSGDTGSAVAHGFYQVPGIEVVLLYPRGKVSPIQEQQLTTLGGNIRALEVDGTFDDCQRMVKQAFLDPIIAKKRTLTSANSINIGRLLPQSFYYFHARAQAAKAGRASLRDAMVFSVPSGNFGNLTAGLLARRMGLPIAKFVAATNANDVVVRYLETGVFSPAPSKQTVSNAMDVGNPSNFARLMDIFSSSRDEMAEELFGVAFTDEETTAKIARQFQASGYILDPHAAVGVLGLERYLATDPGAFGVVLGTAHPAKFMETVSKAIGQPLPLPPSLEATLAKKKQATAVPNDYEVIRELLCS